MNSADPLFGSDQADATSGAGGNVAFLAYDGNDIIDAGPGGDVNPLLDALEISEIEAIDMDYDAADKLALRLEDVVDLSSTADSEGAILLAQALDNSETIYGSQGDMLTLAAGTDGGFEKAEGASVKDARGTSLEVCRYVRGGSYVLVALGVDLDIDNVTSNSATT